MSTRSNPISTRNSIGWHRLTVLGVAAAFVTLALAGGNSGPTAVSVLENTADHVVIQYRLPEFSHRSVDLNGQRYLQIVLEGEPQVLIAGAPDLPHVARSIIIADNGVMDVTVTGSSYYELENIDIAPSKGNLLRSVNPDDVPYEFGEAYQTDAFFPGELARLSAPYIMRDYRGIVVDTFPFQYNPVRRVLRVYTALTVAVDRVADGGVNVLQRDRSEHQLSLAFHEIYQSRFVNYGGGRYPPVGETGDLLIICHDAWIANVEPLAAHKNSIGIATTLVGVSTIGNNATAIKNYISDVYNSSDLAFVLLVGDAAQVATPYASGGASDPSYSKLAGGDNWPEIIVGRLSAETSEQVDTQVERTVEYEVNQATQEEWFWRGMGIASNQGAGMGDEGQSDDEHMAEIRTWLLAYGYTEVDEIYDPYANKTMVTNGLNAGRGIINYCGHGSQTSWGTTGFNNGDINALVNDNMLPFITTVACNNGEFNTGTCFAEAWLRATHGAEPTGAIGCYASSIGQSWAPPMEAQDEFNLLYCAEAYHSYGALCFNGSCSMMEDYGGDGVTMFDTWHVFGDPTLRVVGTTQPPSGLGVKPSTGLYTEGQQGGPFTPDSIEYTLENYDPTPLEYEVTKSVNWVDITGGSGTIPPLSSVLVTVSINSNANSLGNGFYEDTVYFTNLTNHDGDTARPVTLKVGVATLQYAWSLDTDPGWATQGEWAFGHPTGQGGYQHGYPDPTSGATGANVYGVNLNGDYSLTPGGPYYVTLGPVDLTETTEVSLKFQRWLNTDYEPYVFAMIEVSNNGTNWSEIWSNGGSEIAENSWSLREYDISTTANNEATVYIRWGHKVGDYAYAYSGWNIDDIEIWGLKAGTPYELGDLNCDGEVNFDDINPFVLALTDAEAYAAAFPECDIKLADINGDGEVDFSDINPFVGLLSK